MDVRFVDTTLRDGQQSLWALNMRFGMIEAVAESIGRAGFDVVEVPITGLYMKKFVRDHKEDPWEVARMVARTMPHTVKSCMSGPHIDPFEPLQPKPIIELFFACLAKVGALNRAQLNSNTLDQITDIFPWIFPVLRNLGIQVVPTLSYTISPRHTDEYYAQKTRELVTFKPDAIYLKDQGGLLTLDRARTILPSILQNANTVPVELHSHCTTGLAPLVYLEALKAGVRTLHVSIPPLANGSSQPSVFNVASNARMMGYRTTVDETALHSVSKRLTVFARQGRLPVGVPLEHDYGQYVHQVPGGVISILKRQLAEMHMQDRLLDVLAESVQLRKDLGYPIMITPYSQFMVTQSAINVATGERYKHVIDELIQFAQGVYGEDSGYPWMDQTLRDRLLSNPRAKELEERRTRQEEDVPLKEIRKKLGGSGVSDEEFLLRYIMKGDNEVLAMRAAGPPKRSLNTAMPLLTLIQELGKQKKVRYVHFQRGPSSLILKNNALS